MIVPDGFSQAFLARQVADVADVDLFADLPESLPSVMRACLKCRTSWPLGICFLLRPQSKMVPLPSVVLIQHVFTFSSDMFNYFHLFSRCSACWMDCTLSKQVNRIPWVVLRIYLRPGQACFSVHGGFVSRAGGLTCSEIMWDFARMDAHSQCGHGCLELSLCHIVLYLSCLQPD